jgi:hypothetical protein
MENEHPVTQRELHAALTTQKQEITEDLTAVMRQIETHFLTAFHSYAKGQNARLHTMDTRDQELRIRMETLEDRVLTLETRPRL